MGEFAERLCTNECYGSFELAALSIMRFQLIDKTQLT